MARRSLHGAHVRSSIGLLIAEPAMSVRRMRLAPRPFPWMQAFPGANWRQHFRTASSHRHGRLGLGWQRTNTVTVTEHVRARSLHNELEVRNTIGSFWISSHVGRSLRCAFSNVGGMRRVRVWVEVPAIASHGENLI